MIYLLESLMHQLQNVEGGKRILSVFINGRAPINGPIRARGAWGPTHGVRARIAHDGRDLPDPPGGPSRQIRYTTFFIL